MHSTEFDPDAVPLADPLILALEAWDVMSTRTRNCLGHRYVDADPMSTVAKVPIEMMRISHLAGCRPRDIMIIPNLGRTCFCEVMILMGRYGWRFHETWGPRKSTLEYCDPSGLSDRVTRIEKAAEERRKSTERNEAMLRNSEAEGGTAREIGFRFKVSAAVAQTAMQQARRVRELRDLYPIPFIAVRPEGADTMRQSA